MSSDFEPAATAVTWSIDGDSDIVAVSVCYSNGMSVIIGFDFRSNKRLSVDETRTFLSQVDMADVDWYEEAPADASIWEGCVARSDGERWNEVKPNPEQKVR